MITFRINEKIKYTELYAIVIMDITSTKTHWYPGMNKIYRGHIGVLALGKRMKYIK